MKAPLRPPNPYRVAIKGLRGTFIGVAVFSALVNLLMLTGPIFMLQVYDRVLSSASVTTLVGLFGVVCLLYAFMALYDFFRARMLSHAGYRLDSEVGAQGFQLWLQRGLGGNTANRRPLGDLAVVRGFLSSPALTGMFDLPWVPFFLVVVFAVHAWLGWLVLGGAVVVTCLALLGQYLTDASYRRAMRMDGGESFFVEQVYRNAEPLAALGMTRRVTDLWRKMHDEGLATGQTGGDRSEVLAAISKAFRLLMQSATLGLGAYLAIYQEISAGMISAVSIIAGRALAPIDQVIGQWRSVVRAREAHGHLLEMMDEIPQPRRLTELPEPTGKLSVRGLVKFAPGQVQRGDRPPTLADVTFSLEPGDALGVIGPSASGKSTLARLIVGTWKPDSGEVRLDGATYDQWEPERLGRYIGFLPQSLELLAGSVRDNIARFDPEAKDADVIEAAKMAGVHDLIQSLPGGYGAQLGYGAQPLSGGQIQRIGLARALFGKPKLIVLDEPNSNLDAQGDEALARAILAMRAAGSTLIVMAHRPSAMAAVNKVLVLQGGRMAHFGDRDTVLAEATRQPGTPPPAPALPPGGKA